MTEFYDERETQDPAAREANLMARLPAQVAHARANAPYFRTLLADIDPAAITSRAALATLPVTRKSDLIALQPKAPPFGGLTAENQPIGHIFQSPGPINDPETHGAAYWRMARALFAAGFRRGDIVQNCYSYHFTPAGFMFDDSARALGCTVFPAGTGQTEQQVRAMAAIRATAYTGTPSFLKLLLEKAAELDLDVSSLAKASVSGEALPADLRATLRAYGVAALQAYGTADLGLIAYETEALEGLIVDEDVIVEIVRPGTGDPLPEGEVGEVVVTTFATEYPLLRFGTGDLSAVLPGSSPCGRTNMRIKGWMGRADQGTKVKGMFVHPPQVAEVLRRHPEIVKARLVVDRIDGADAMTLKVEGPGPVDVAGVADSLQAVTKLRGRVVLVDPGTLPNDGKVIEDIRPVG